MGCEVAGLAGLAALLGKPADFGLLAFRRRGVMEPIEVDLQEQAAEAGDRALLLAGLLDKLVI
jgi:hypothetical protein